MMSTGVVWKGSAFPLRDRAATGSTVGRRFVSIGRSMVFVIAIFAGSVESGVASIVDRYEDPELGGLPYRLHLPVNYDPNRAYPVLTYVGRQGLVDDLNDLDDAELGMLLALQNPDYASFLVIPQFPSSAVFGLATTSRHVVALLDSLQDSYLIDASRQYVTGFSVGGFFTYNLAGRHPGYFAAAVPVAGFGGDGFLEELVGTSIWAFHSAGDGIVSSESTRSVIRGLRALGAEPRYTEYEGTNHDAWTPAYSEESGLYDWLFTQSRAVPEPSLGAVAVGVALMAGLLRVPTCTRMTS